MAADETKKEEKKDVSKNVAKIVEDVKGLSVLELSELVNTLQEELGVTAAPMAAAPVAAGAAAGGDEAAAGDEASGGGTVVLTDAGSQKIQVIKALREINQNWGLKEAKEMTESTPVEVLKDAKPEEAKEAAEKLKAAGATVELK